MFPLDVKLCNLVTKLSDHKQRSLIIKEKTTLIWLTSRTIGHNVIAKAEVTKNYEDWHRIYIGFRSCRNIVSKWDLAPVNFIIGRVWWWNWYSAHINLNNCILWGIIPISRIFAKKWHFLSCSGGRYSFWPFALNRDCALHFRPCERRRKTYFACGLAGFSKMKRWIPE